MDITRITQSNTAGINENQRNVSRQLGKDEFMEILVAQLRNQDPLSPMEDKDFIAQMAQFSLLEQLQNMNEGATFAQAASLVGKQILSVISDKNGVRKEINGLVESAQTINKIPYLEVNGYLVPYSSNLVVLNSDSNGSQEL